ncbi:MAG: hypothetical protein U1E05_18600, partial [Patescibacteria group bacterium]|nr:hypothetical protein [Patescibacteria group bacterium]
MTIRFQIIIWAIAVIVLANLALSAAGVSYLGHRWREEVQTWVQLDLRSARAAYDSRTERIEAFLRGTALADSLAQTLQDSPKKRDCEPIRPIFDASNL